MARTNIKASASKSQLAIATFLAVRQNSDLEGKWILDQVIVDVINESQNIDNKISKVELNRAVSNYYKNKADILLLHTSNKCGVYKLQNERRINGKRGRVTCYFFTTSKDETPIQPNSSTKMYETRESIELPTTSQETHPLTNTLVEDIELHPVKKRVIIKEEGRKVEKVYEYSNNELDKLKNDTFWDSPEAKCWFGAGEKNEIIEDTMVKRIKRLKAAYMRSEGWRDIVSDNDQKEMCTNHDIYLLRSKAMFLGIALKLALDHMPLWTWASCCDEAIKKVASFHQLLGDDDDISLATKCGGTIQRWFRLWKFNNECFSNPHFIRRGKTAFPPLLENYPTFRKNLVKEMDDNLAHLSGEYVFNYVVDTALPNILKERQKELNNDKLTTKELLLENGLTKLSLSTVYRWMNMLGFKYEERKKCYYVDNHESEENVIYRRRMLKRYFNYEIRAHRWIQQPLEEAKALEEKGDISIGNGYKYDIKDNTDKTRTFVEFHVDDSIAFEDFIMKTKFGGNLSVRKPPNTKPLFMFGQDECIFKQYTFSKKAWKGSDGRTALIPKDEGAGIMISAFVSREFGYGFPLTNEDLTRIN